ncbi:MAG: hypothetical protein PVF47_14230, partial [Anaerolineae bacterium]
MLDRVWWHNRKTGSPGLACRPPRFLLLLLLVCFAAFPGPILAQEEPEPTPTVTGEEAPIEAPDRVEVRPEARDDEIR